MKVWERVVEMRVRRDVAIFENQFGFMSGLSTTKVIHLIRWGRRTYIWLEASSRYILLEIGFVLQGDINY